MDKKQEIINEYLYGTVGYRVLSKKYEVSRSGINRWVMDFHGQERSKSPPCFVAHEIIEFRIFRNANSNNKKKCAIKRKQF